MEVLLCTILYNDTKDYVANLCLLKISVHIYMLSAHMHKIFLGLCAPRRQNHKNHNQSKSIKNDKKKDTNNKNPFIPNLTLLTNC